MNFRISRQKINIIYKIKYLGLILDEHLTFKYHLENLKLKLNRANCLLLKIRYFVKILQYFYFSLRTIYCAHFDFHLRYGCQIWGQIQNKVIEAIERTQNKAMRILNFMSLQAVVGNLHKESKIDKLKRIIAAANYLIVYDQLKNNLSETFNNVFTINTQLHKHSNRKNRLILPNVKGVCRIKCLKCLDCPSARVP